MHLLANCLLLFVQQSKSNPFDEQLKDAKKRLKKSKYLLEKAGSLRERQAAGEKLTLDEETKISNISEFKASIQFYENRIRELESVLNAPSEKKDLEKQERKLCKKIRQGVSLSYKDDSELDQFAKEKIQNLPEFRDELSRVRQRISRLEDQTKDIVRQNQLEQVFLDWSIEYIKDLIGFRFLTLRFLLEYLKIEDLCKDDWYYGWKKLKLDKEKFSGEEYSLISRKGFVSSYDDMVDYDNLTSSLYTKFLYSLEEKAVDGHTYNPAIDDWEPLDVFQHYLVKEGGSYFTHLSFGFSGSSLDMAKLFITKYVLKESNVQNSKVPIPFNFVKSDETIPPGWIDLWKFLKRIFPYSRDNILMILLYNQTVQYHFRRLRIDLDHVFPYYESSRSEIYEKILSELFVEKTESKKSPNLAIRLINKFIGVRIDARNFKLENDPMRKTVLFNPEFFQFTVERFLYEIFTRYVLLKEIGEFQLWNYLLNDFSGPIVIERGSYGVSERRNFFRETYPNYIESGKQTA